MWPFTGTAGRDAERKLSSSLAPLLDNELRNGNAISERHEGKFGKCKLLVTLEAPFRLQYPTDHSISRFTNTDSHYPMGVGYQDLTTFDILMAPEGVSPLQQRHRIALPGGDFLVLTDMLAKDGTADEVNRNVVRVTAGGERVWAIQTDATADERLPYTHLALDELGRLKVYSWSGVEYEVDPETGSISAGVFVR